MSETHRKNVRVSRGAALLGVALGLAMALVALRFAPKRAVPRALVRGESAESVQRIPGAILPEDEGPLVEILVQYAPNLEGVIADTYRDFLAAIDPSVHIVAVIPRGGGADAALRTFWNAIDASLLPRTRVVEVDGPITVWSKDRALVLEPLAPFATQTRTTFVIPTPPDPKWVERTHDWATLGAVASMDPEHFVVREIPLDFDAGDFAVTGDRVLFDANLVEKNRARGLDTREKIAPLVRALFGREVTMLGEAAGDVPRHHMSMYMTPLGRDAKGTPRVLVGDPRAARDALGAAFDPKRTSPDTGEALLPDFSDASIARFERAARDLAAAGFAVVRIPVVPFEDKTYITYTNGVYETRGESRVAYVPQYGIASLDVTARSTYESLGWTVRPIRVDAPWPFHGTIGCLTNVLRRR